MKGIPSGMGYRGGLGGHDIDEPTDVVFIGGGAKPPYYI